MILGAFILCFNPEMFSILKDNDEMYFKAKVSF